MEIIRPDQQAPDTVRSSIFLAGPTPRDPAVATWRKPALDILAGLNYAGVVFVPEPADENWPSNYHDQVDWEERHRAMADLIVFWCPRDLTVLPGFTTNVEFGLDMHTGKVRYGRPRNAPKTRYLDWQYHNHMKRSPATALDALLAAAAGELGDGAARTGGERHVPLAMWQTRQFQDWYAAQRRVGNRLDHAQPLWQFAVTRNGESKNVAPWCYALKVKMWVAAEARHKHNEFVLSRPDTFCTVAYRTPPGGRWLDAEVVLVREFRAGVRTPDGFVHELPGGSSFDVSQPPRDVAASELREETGLDVTPERLREIRSRQLVGSFCSHHAYVFAVELTADELQTARDTERDGAALGVEGASETTYVEIRTLRDMLGAPLVDWSTLGMITEALAPVTADAGLAAPAPPLPER